jgi:hypothetical protein
MAITATVSALVASVGGPLISVIATHLPHDAAGSAAPLISPEPNYVYLQPGEKAPLGATVMTLDPQISVAAPLPGSVVIVPQQRQTIYIYLQPGETPPVGAIVRTTGSVLPVATTKPVSSSPTPSSGGSGGNGGGATPAPTPVVAPPPTPKPPPPPTTKPSGAP